jgi:transcriptional regulator with PAS, ATPase and Fis domain
MLKIYRLIEKVARTNTTALILGESGTGKELIARALHKSSPRNSSPLVKVNCAAMPETLLESELFGYVKGAFTGANTNKKGLFETAHGGTIFLDEIGSIPMPMQMTLLRVLQEKEIRHVGGTEDINVDVRVIAATNENLEEKVAKGEFREDLYFRLSVIPVKLPPLRERKKDIPMLAMHFLAEFEKENNTKIRISSEAMNMLSAYDWPGNIRELENNIKRMATLNDSGEIDITDLPPELKTNAGILTSGIFTSARIQSSDNPSLPLKKHMKLIEKKYIKEVVDKHDGNKEKAAEALDISLATLYRKIEKGN